MRRLARVAAALSLCAASPAQAHEVDHYDPVPEALLAAAPPAETGKLSADWCGRELSGDDTAHETGSRQDAKFKVIEAYPADVAAWPGRRNEIQAAVMRAFDHVAAESGAKRSIRFDLGTQCGARYADIQTMHFQETKAELAGDGCFDGLATQVRDATPGAAGVRNYIVFAPEVDCNTGGYGEFPNDDRKTDLNKANEGDRVALIFATSWLGGLHEMLHTVGAVQKSAPHNDPQTYHCWDGVDVMCYIGAYPVGGLPALPVCDGDPPPLDCNKDDYFNPSPPDGSYLQSHWNVWDSIFLCEFADCVPPVAPPPLVSGPATPPAAAPPRKPAAKKKRKVAKKRCTKAKKKRARSKRRCKHRRRR